MFLSIPPRQVLPSSLACVLMISRLFSFLSHAEATGVWPRCGVFGRRFDGDACVWEGEQPRKRGVEIPSMGLCGGWGEWIAHGSVLVRIEENLLLLLNVHTGLAVGSDLGGGVGWGWESESGWEHCTTAICTNLLMPSAGHKHQPQPQCSLISHRSTYLSACTSNTTSHSCTLPALNSCAEVLMKQTDVSKKIVWYRDTSDMPLAGPAYLRTSNLC